MAANLGTSSETGLIEFLGLQRYHDYFGEAEGGDLTVGGTSADANNACALESIVDNLLLEAFGLEQEVATTSMFSIGTCRFAASKTGSDCAISLTSSNHKSGHVYINCPGV